MKNLHIFDDDRGNFMIERLFLCMLKNTVKNQVLIADTSIEFVLKAVKLHIIYIDNYNNKQGVNI